MVLDAVTSLRMKTVVTLDGTVQTKFLADMSNFSYNDKSAIAQWVECVVSVKGTVA
jgi:hypothetical protein